MRLHLTKSAIEDVPIPAIGAVTVYDEDTPGLTLRISHTGSRTWRYYRSHHGRPLRRAIGPYPDVSIARARQEAAAISRTYILGEDPRTDGRQRGGIYLGELWTRYMQDARRRKRERSWREEERLWRRHLAHWAGKPAGTITRTMVARLHAAIGREHPTTANRVLAALRAAYGWALRLDLVDGNPCSGVRQYPERPRERFLEGEELAQFWAALQAPETPVDLRAFVLLALLTGQRSGNLRAMRWRDVDLFGGVWSVAGQTTKNGHPLRVPLLPDAVELLTDRRRHIAGEYVFPSPKRRARVPYVQSWKSSWADLLRRAGITDLRVHDLRHTAASWMTIENTSPTIVGRALGHRDHQSTDRYSHLTIDPVRDGMARGWAALRRDAEGAG